jgi:dTMP kinase
MRKKRGVFIVLEGIDGSGTTTIGRMLESELKDKGIMCHYTFEPTMGPIGALIKNILSKRIVMNGNGRSGSIDQRAVALLFAADRIDHLENEVLPLVKKGFVVISDRYKYSSYAYQSLFASGEWVYKINEFAIDPDLLIYLDVDVETGLKRVGFRGSVREIYEKADVLKNVRKRYLRHVRGLGYAHIVDANRTIDEVYLDVRGLTFERLRGYGYKI